jgi:hypothetical protein
VVSRKKLLPGQGRETAIPKCLNQRHRAVQTRARIIGEGLKMGIRVLPIGVSVEAAAVARVAADCMTRGVGV